jgi:DNA-binding MarR family transcriptional regulator/GNAT superfamily N-acetyltransferase
MVSEAAIAGVRRFNRVVTQRVGALEEAFLSRGRPLGQARVLWEIGTSACEVRDLRSRLQLDSGYLSRLLRALEADGLVHLETGEGDARARSVRLTPAGLAERAELDRRSDHHAGVLLAGLTPAQQVRLVEAMGEVERLLTTSAVRIAPIDPMHPDARHCLRSYLRELSERFDTGFDPARSISARSEELIPPAGLMLLARMGTEPVGCGAVKFRADGRAEVKRMWVAPSARGLGLGRQLLEEIERHAVDRGIHTLRLETNRSLVEAIGLYRAAGFHEVQAFNDERYAHHWFEKHLDGDRASEATGMSVGRPGTRTEGG